MAGLARSAYKPAFLAGEIVLELVVAVDENDAIGRDNALPWHMPADLKHFKALTTGKPILMGRKTFESIGKALPNRVNLVMSRSPDFHAENVKLVSTLAEAVTLAGPQSLMVIGGATIFEQTAASAALIHLSVIHTRIVAADTFFSAWHGEEWQERDRVRHVADEKNPFDYSFITLERRV
jgi:dihydrofolate reductase